MKLPARKIDGALNRMVRWARTAAEAPDGSAREADALRRYALAERDARTLLNARDGEHPRAALRRQQEANALRGDLRKQRKAVATWERHATALQAAVKHPKLRKDGQPKRSQYLGSKKRKLYMAEQALTEARAELVRTEARLAELA